MTSLENENITLEWWPNVISSSFTVLLIAMFCEAYSFFLFLLCFTWCNYCQCNKMCSLCARWRFSSHEGFPPPWSRIIYFTAPKICVFISKSSFTNLLKVKLFKSHSQIQQVMGPARFHCARAFRELQRIQQGPTTK